MQVGNDYIFKTFIKSPFISKLFATCQHHIKHETKEKNLFFTKFNDSEKHLTPQLTVNKSKMWQHLNQVKMCTLYIYVNRLV